MEQRAPASLSRNSQGSRQRPACTCQHQHLLVPQNTGSALPELTAALRLPAPSSPFQHRDPTCAPSHESFFSIPCTWQHQSQTSTQTSNAFEMRRTGRAGGEGIPGEPQPAPRPHTQHRSCWKAPSSPRIKPRKPSRV